MDSNIIIIHYDIAATLNYPYLCYQLHLGVLYPPLQGVGLMGLCQDLNDEFILEWKIWLLICIGAVGMWGFNPGYLDGGPSVASLLPSAVSGLQLLQEFAVEHLQLLLQSSQLFLQRHRGFLRLKVFLLPAVTRC